MKKLLTTFMALALALTPSTAFAGEKDSVSVKFRIGESVLSINGQDVEVEKPYIAGEGTTLVPLRVITEAFGAVVEWIGETRTINISYKDVYVVLNVGDNIAKVNDHNETLAEAPVITPNGITMVPLRFVSETFGADVEYDDGYITVIKEGSIGGEIVSGKVDMPKIGDSFYGWSVDNPTSLTMFEREFDGRYTHFSNGTENLVIEVMDNKEEPLTIEEEYSYVKDYMEGATLTKSEILTDKNGKRFICCQARTKQRFLSVISYVTEEYIYEVGISCDVDAEKKDELVKIQESFCLDFSKENTHDLSNINDDGTRTFTDIAYKISCRVPQQLYQQETEMENEFILLDEDGDIALHITVFSKTDEVTAQKLAQKDFESRSKYASPKWVIMDGVKEVKIGEISGYGYTETITSSAGLKEVRDDRFVEVGRYVYNICTTIVNDEANSDKIFGTFEIEALDEEKIGTLIRNDFDVETIRKYAADSFYVKAPRNWDGYASEDAIMLLEKHTAATLIAGVLEIGSLSLSEIKQTIKDIAKTEAEDKDAKIFESVSETQVKGMKAYTYSVKRTEEDVCVYVKYYYIYKNNKLYVVSFVQPENTIDTALDDEFNDILQSFTIEKK